MSLPIAASLGPLEVLIVVALYLLPAFLVARLAQRKGHSFGAFLVLGLLVSWVVSFVVALVVEDRSRPRRVAVEATPPDSLDQLAKLNELRESGAISPEEFEAKKAELLNRV